MGMREYIISGFLVGLFSISFLYFILIVSQDNDSVGLINDKTLNKTFYSLNSSLSGIQAKTESEYNATATEPISAGFGSIILFSIRNAGTVFGGSVTSIIKPLLIFSQETLGIPPVVLGIISAIIIVSLIFLGWKMYRLGI
jgi:hypothetical protein